MNLAIHSKLVAVEPTLTIHVFELELSAMVMISPPLLQYRESSTVASQPETRASIYRTKLGKFVCEHAIFGTSCQYQGLCATAMRISRNLKTI
jgi:hypothetical protein